MEADSDLQIIEEKIASPNKLNGAAGTKEILGNVGKWMRRENGKEWKDDTEMNGTDEESQRQQEKDTDEMGASDRQRQNNTTEMGTTNSQHHTNTYEMGASNSQWERVTPKSNTGSPLRSWGQSVSTVTPGANKSSPIKSWGQSTSTITPESNKGSPIKSWGQSISTVTLESNKGLPKKSEGQTASKKSPQNDVAEALSQWWQSRRQGSPRKYHQGLKQTGLLMNSAKTYPIMASPSKKSTAPQTSPSPQKGSPRKVLFRHTRGTYLDSLMIVLETVMSQPQDVALLGEEDVAVVERFCGLSLPAQKLYVRLLQRKLDLKRMSKVVYEDVCEPEEMGNVAQELVEAGFLLKEEDLGGLLEFLEVLTVAEVQELCKEMKVPAKGNKEDRVKALIKFSQQQPSIKDAFFAVSKTAAKPSPSPLFKKAREMAGPCLKLDGQVHRVFLRMLMLYGLPSYDDMEEGGPQAALTAMLLINIGKMRFPAYTVNRTRVIFRTHEDLLRFEGCCHIHQELQKCIEGKKLEEALQHCRVAKDTYLELSKDEDLIHHDHSLPRFLRRFTALSLLTYMLSVMVDLLQKLRQYEEAVTLLEELLAQDTHLQDHRGLWYTRLALNLHSHLRKPAKALDVIERGLHDPELQHAHRLTLSCRARRLARSDALAQRVDGLPLVEPVVVPKVVIQGRSVHGDMPGYKRAFIRQGSDRHAGEGTVTLCSVEELVIGHYQQMGYPEGLHMEGTTVRSLFGLLLWDALYAPVPDAFRSPHQASPLDLLDQHFYTARKELIDKRLSAMRAWTDDEADAEVARVWVEHEEEQCLVAWNIFSSLSYVQGLVKSLGLEVLAAVFERLAKNYRHTRSGFPDLIVWNPVTKKARIVEVKGPNDTLSVKQEVWLEYLVSCKAVAEVCHVEAIGAKKMTRTSPRKTSPKKPSPKKSPPKKTAKRPKSSDDEDDEDDEDEDEEYRPSRPKRSTSKQSKGSDEDDLDEEYSPSAPRKSLRRKSLNADDSGDDFVCPVPETRRKKAKKDEDVEVAPSRPKRTASKRSDKGQEREEVMMTGDDSVCLVPETRSKKAKKDEEEDEDDEVAPSRPKRTASKRSDKGQEREEVMMTGDDSVCLVPETRSKKAKRDEEEDEDVEVAPSRPKRTASKRGTGRGRRGKK
ncbi:fanconi-associated nuclease 1-like isoform X2 [Eriocheir sinensis]|uniref:fanconi-associated nuclease 1-like isoform X2 n=1 Tax=Eriocheir sinensis TaxID=95602 RepID=UPI0021C8A6C4|nr:fanconi-associated nuclease 1-like isoform X2 [Eriocheir sinensis]